MGRLTIDRRVERLEQAAMLEGEARLFAILADLTSDDLYDLITPMHRAGQWDAGRTPHEASVFRRFEDAGGTRYYSMALGIRDDMTIATPELRARVKQIAARLEAEHRWRFEDARRRRQREQEPARAAD